MYGTCETLCRELAAKYPGDTPLMLVIWSPEEIQALADGMDISLSDHEIRTVGAHGGHPGRPADWIRYFFRRGDEIINNVRKPPGDRPC